MQQDELYASISEIEMYLSKGFHIFGVYVLVKKHEIYDKFQALYNSLPQEIINNRDYLNTNHEENIFTILNKINFMFENTKTFSNFILLNENIMMNYIYKMYVILPENIKLCCKNED